MKRSEILWRVLVGIFIAFVIAVFVIPQDVLNYNEVLFLWVLLPIIGALWIRFLIDLTKGS
jgi:hypothetical protein